MADYREIDPIVRIEARLEELNAKWDELPPRETSPTEVTSRKQNRWVALVIIVIVLCITGGVLGSQYLERPTVCPSVEQLLDAALEIQEGGGQ